MQVLEEIYSGLAASILVEHNEENEGGILEDIDKFNQLASKQFLTQLRVTCENGLIRDEKKFKHLEDGIYEFKPSGVRVLCFIVPGSKPPIIVLSHFFKKPTGKKRYKPEIKKAKELSKKIVELYKQKKIEIIK